jgi:Lar family restriction alleviation protein
MFSAGRVRSVYLEASHDRGSCAARLRRHLHRPDLAGQPPVESDNADGGRLGAVLPEVPARCGLFVHADGLRMGERGGGMSDNLAPCPFCGSDQVILYRDMSHDSHEPSICCHDCLIEMMLDGGFKDEQAAEDALVERWNTRVIEQRARVELDALQETLTDEQARVKWWKGESERAKAKATAVLSRVAVLKQALFTVRDAEDTRDPLDFYRDLAHAAIERYEETAGEAHV